MKTVYVVFKGYSSKTYSYLYDLNDPVEKGDVVVVDSPSEGFVTVKVTDVFDGVVGSATKYIVDKVDTTSYKQRVERAAEAAKVKSALESLLKKQEESLRYAILAQTEEGKKLLNRLKELQA